MKEGEVGWEMYINQIEGASYDVGILLKHLTESKQFY